MSRSPRSSGGYNNPAYCTKMEPEQRARNMFPMTSYHYAPVNSRGGDNYCYVDDEAEDEYEFHISAGRYCTIEDEEIREPPIGASTTFRTVETNSRQRSSAEMMTSQGRIRVQAVNQNEREVISPPRTPRKNAMVITSTPRKTTPQKRVPQDDNYPTSPRMPMKQQKRQDQNYARCTVQCAADKERGATIFVSVTVTYQQHCLSVSDDGTPDMNFPPAYTTSPMRSTGFDSSRVSSRICSSSRTPLSPISQARKAIVYAPTTTSITSTTSKEMQRPYQERRCVTTPDNRSTAVIIPISSGKSSLSTVPMPNKQASPDLKPSSWIHAPEPYQPPPTGALVVAGLFLLLCGTITTVLCFYMMWREGRRYYLDFGVLFGFLSVVLGCLGFRSRNWQWLPNRNYVSGYIVLSLFSVLCAAGLIVLLVVHPRPGEPLADVAGGAVCGVAVLSLLLAATGAGASQCCKYPPPDNRVQHCAEGFTL